MTEPARADLDRLRDLLARLEDRLLRDKPDLQLPPGLPPERSRAMAAELGLRLTDELVTFYAWHDGLGSIRTPIDGQPNSLADGLTMTTYKRQQTLEWHGEHGLEPEQIYPDHWFSPNNYASFQGATLDLSVEPDRETPVLTTVLLEAGTPDYPRVSFPSWGHVVSIWIELFDTGAYWWDRQTGHARSDLINVPGDIRQTDLF